ncbi:uncharacterized protein YcfL [Cricetibacter osteomyelitidis]|uniref:Uncharacterized protein YcfL n=1 Tax=Cricetibacter osteomyelitidis TaxID=1521931 RepID=A0A4R2T7P8_9PAST|nr:YcfL family protein [Cricetibacter osteomyelitidis]TCP96884.1 uncharacterized protein YcfL [Cricetibacter osteomyelitidis]
MKKIIFLFLTALLAACSSQPNLVHTNKPILNIESTLNPNVDVSLHSSSATIRNTSDYALSINYLVTWYNANGITQLPDSVQDKQFQSFRLQAKEKITLQFTKPTNESMIYRLYMALK